MAARSLAPIARGARSSLVRSSVAWLAVAALAAAPPPAAQTAAQNGDWRARRAEIVAGSIPKLEALADWCNANEIFIERDQVFEHILRLDPENYRAHKGLKHVQSRDGKWLPPEKPVPPKNFNPGAAAKFAERRRKALEPTCDALLALIDEFGLAGADREALHADVLSFDPEDPRVHAARGELALDGAWVLAETVAAKRRRAELKSQVRAALADVPEPESFQFEPGEPTHATTWTAAVRTPAVRVLSTGAADEAATIARHASATGALLVDVLALAPKPNAKPDAEPGAKPVDEAAAKRAARRPMTVYVLTRPEQLRPFLESHPDVKPERVEGLCGMISIGLNVAGDCVITSADAGQRLDCAVRQAIAHVLIDELHVDLSHGWAFEGFGLYLTRELTGTRLTWFALPENAEPEQKALRKKLLDAKSNWMNDAHELLEGPRKPDLGELLAKDGDALTIEDLLYAYVLAAYLLEARAESVPALLRSLGAKEPPGAAFERTLGLDLVSADARVRRWLSERR